MVSKVLNSLSSWFYTTWAGNLYFNLLLFIDRKFNKQDRFLSPKEIAQVVKQYSLLHEGVNQIKRKIDTLVKSKSKEEYSRVLGELENMVDLSERDMDTPQGRFAEMLRQIAVKKGTVDIVTHTDKAKMIDQRIGDMYELQDHIVKRTLLRKIRTARSNGEVKEASKLEKEYLGKYGRSSR